jgi:hypothetical protein
MKLNIENIVANRNYSGFNVSIGTGIALETIFTPTEAVYDSTRIFKKRPLKEKESYGIDIYTLARNLFSAIDRDYMKEILAGDNFKPIEDALREEINIIHHLCLSVGATFHIFRPNFNSLLGLKKKEITTSSITGLLMQVIEVVGDNVYNNLDTDVYNLNKPKNLTIITSHIALDLLGVNSNCLLLESITGELVKKRYWAKKLKLPKGADPTRVPVTVSTIKIFGDKSNYIVPRDGRWKRKFYDYMVKYKTNYNTTEQRIRTLVIMFAREISE